jgi:transposase
MIPKEIRDRIQKLRAQGHGIRWIARHLKLSRNSVRTVLREEKPPPEADAPASRSSLLDPYKKRIVEILQEEEREQRKHPGRKPLTTRWFLKEIRKAGYRGSHTILDDYLRELRGPSRRARRASARFETAVAEEAQQDWSTYRVLIAGCQVTIQLFSMILSWSRYQFLRGYRDQRQGTLLWAHAAAFRFFQGVPWKIVYDRQATITPCEIAGQPLIHETFRRFAEHYGYEIFLCEPGDKERKGKIERPFHTFETQFLPRRQFDSLEDFNLKLERWLNGGEDPEEGNRRQHGTTGEVPYERWLQERRLLYELPRTDLLPRRVEERTVNHDCTISVLGCLYTVPARVVERGDRKVWVSIGEGDLLVYDRKGELLATHRLSEGKGKLVIDEAHYREIRRRKGSRPLPELERLFLGRFGGCRDFLDALKRTVRSIAPIHLREIIALARRYPPEEVERAMALALEHGTATSGYVRGLLSRRHPTGPMGEIQRQPPKGLSLGPVDPGSAESYKDIFNQTEKEDNDASDHSH